MAFSLFRPQLTLDDLVNLVDGEVYTAAYRDALTYSGRETYLSEGERDPLLLTLREVYHFYIALVGRHPVLKFAASAGMLSSSALCTLRSAFDVITRFDDPRPRYGLAFPEFESAMFLPEDYVFLPETGPPPVDLTLRLAATIAKYVPEKNRCTLSAEVGYHTVESCHSLWKLIDRRQTFVPPISRPFEEIIADINRYSSVKLNERPSP